jgi:hypothetical protein
MSDMTNEPADRPLEPEGVPSQENVEPTDFQERLEVEPDEAANAPNRDPYDPSPAEPPAKTADDEEDDEPHGDPPVHGVVPEDL